MKEQGIALALLIISPVVLPTESPVMVNSEDETESPPPRPEDIEIPPSEEVELATADQYRPTGKLILRSSTSTDSAWDAQATGSAIFDNEAAFQATQPLGKYTFLQGEVGGRLVRYHDGLGYNQLNTKLGVAQNLSTSMSGDLGWTYQRIYGLGSLAGLEDNGVRLSLRRDDALVPELFLQSGYELQANFSRPVDRSRLSHRLNLNIRYSLLPKLWAGISYWLFHNDFTHLEISDTYHEVGPQIFYYPWDNNNTYLGASVAYIFGNNLDLLSSSDKPEEVDNFSVRLQLGVDFTLF